MAKSPIEGMVASDYEQSLYSIRRTLCDVNKTLRFKNDMIDLKQVENDYVVACAKFFAKRIAQMKRETGATRNEGITLETLAGVFADVSFYANIETPIAAPIPAEAAVLGREIIAQQKWFEVEDESNMKKRYGSDW